MTDCQLVIMIKDVTRIDLTHVTGFRDEQMVGAYSGTFHIERGSRPVDDLFGLLDASFFAQTTQPVTIYRYEPGGDDENGAMESVKVYRYDDARLSLAPGGVAFTASGRVRV